MDKQAIIKLFEEIIELWRNAEESNIQERSTNYAKDYEWLEKKMQEFRQRYQTLLKEGNNATK